MPAYFFDSSAWAKHYVAEPGTLAVDHLLVSPGSHLVARLALVELPSAFAKKVRTGQMTLAGFTACVQGMRADVLAGRVAVVQMTRRHHAWAARLIAIVGLRQNLRSLDSLQLAVALHLKITHPDLTLVSADLSLLGIAAAQGLTTIHV